MDFLSKAKGFNIHDFLSPKNLVYSRKHCPLTTGHSVSSIARPSSHWCRWCRDGARFDVGVWRRVESVVTQCMALTAKGAKYAGQAIVKRRGALTIGPAAYQQLVRRGAFFFVPQVSAASIWSCRYWCYLPVGGYIFRWASLCPAVQFVSNENGVL